MGPSTALQCADKAAFRPADTTSRLGAHRQLLRDGHINPGFATLTSDVGNRQAFVIS